MVYLIYNELLVISKWTQGSWSMPKKKKKTLFDQNQVTKLTDFVSITMISHIAWVWEKGCTYIKYALSKWYEIFWDKPNNKIVQTVTQSE